MINTVLFDFGNVLAKVNKMRACRQFSKFSPYSAKQIYRLLVGSDLERALESGRISGVTFCNKVLDQIKSTLTTSEVMHIWGNIFNSNPKIEPIIKELIEKRIKLGVLSDTNQIHWPYMVNLPVMKALIKYKAPMILSWRIKVLKPDWRVFKKALASLRALPKETLYLDDIRENVQAARCFGIQSKQCDCSRNPAQIEIILKHYRLL